MLILDQLPFMLCIINVPERVLVPLGPQVKLLLTFFSLLLPASCKQDDVDDAVSHLLCSELSLTWLAVVVL